MASEVTRRDLPDATVARLPGYLRTLTELRDAGTTRVSSDELATACGVGSAQLRKDLSYLGTYGVRGVGYDVAQLGTELSRALGGERDWPLIIVGLGHLGRALAGYPGFAHRGFHVVGLIDEDPALVGERIGGVPVAGADTLAALVAAHPGAIAVIATPAATAQGVCQRLVDAGIRSILSFAPVPLAAPAEVDVRRVDLATELQLLAVHQLADEEPGTAP